MKPWLYYNAAFFCSSRIPIPEIKKWYYETLGVDKEANSLEIKEAYLNLARKFHPDKHPEALEYFTHVTKWYETLYDDHKRAIYDEDSLTDREFFTIKLGPLKINLLIVFPFTLVLFIGLIYSRMKNKKVECPIDHDHQQMFKRPEYQRK